MVIKVGQIWTKSGGNWSSGSRGIPVIVIKVDDSGVQYRYLDSNISSHNYSSGWSILEFEKAFELHKDVE
jgi:hypothetical protein